MKIGVLDYGVGNLASIVNAFDRLRVRCIISSEITQLKNTDALVLPGDGAAGQGMENLQKLCLDTFLLEELKRGKPFLGICLGMQLLMDFSEEGNVDCLKLIQGSVGKLHNKLKVPQIGWNTVRIISKSSRILKGIKNDSYFYFINSFICKPYNRSIISGETLYGQPFCSTFEKNNIFGVQFHPEKSGNAGMQLLKNFLEVSL